MSISSGRIAGTATERAVRFETDRNTELTIRRTSTKMAMVVGKKGTNKFM